MHLEIMYEAKKFEHLLGLEGFSDRALKNHFALYEGYVNNTNKLITAFEQMADEDKLGAPEFAELKRRFGWEFDGMRLHELYFSGLSKDANEADLDGELVSKIVDDFGSFEDWEKEFKAVGAMRGIGWAILCYDPIGNRLLNVWINEHNEGHLPLCVPLLVMDVFEHAFMIDYDTKRADYIAAFMKAIDWDEIEARFRKIA